ncbi:hypothetical protein GCM10022262_40670 [Georgenia daeguensis]|uniref:Secreted protein n=1 Tax=Georgenia daeguensis TaxID=908355 RepID=A0ABP6UM52_9MICO
MPVASAALILRDAAHPSQDRRVRVAASRTWQVTRMGLVLGVVAARAVPRMTAEHHPHHHQRARQEHRITEGLTRVNGQWDVLVGGRVISLWADSSSPCPRSVDLPGC